MVETLWWMGFLTAVGLVLGSFLNVVVYRVPRGLAMHRPAWSFCPVCRVPIRWYDNLPILSFVHLRGRCRNCRHRIPYIYPAVELLCAVTVLLLFDTFVVAQARAGLHPYEGLSWRLATDWAILLAHILLCCCMLAMALIDIGHYWIDVRFTYVAAAAGTVLHVLWTPPQSAHWPRPWDRTSAVTLAVLVGLAGTAAVVMLLRRRGHGSAIEPTGPGSQSAQDAPRDAASSAAVAPSGDIVVAEGVAAIAGDDEHHVRADRAAAGAEEQAPASHAHPFSNGGSGGSVVHAGVGLSTEASPTSDQPVPAESAGPSPALAWGAVGLALVGATVLLSMFVEAAGMAAGLSFHWRAAAVLVAFFVLAVSAGAIRRESDTEIYDAIEAERGDARGMVARELLMLLPAVAFGAVAWWLVQRHQAVPEWWASVLHARVGTTTWQPLWGFTTAVTGFVIGGALGWAIRIVFTLALGKEAFGTGDIHLLAAAGCVAGWPVVVLGFMVTSFLALGGWLVALPFKRARALPLVPWLSLGILTAVVFYDDIVASWPVRNAVELFNMLISQTTPLRAVWGR